MNKKKRGNILVSSHFVDDEKSVRALYEAFTPVLISLSSNGRTLEMAGYCELFEECPAGEDAPLYERFKSAPLYDILFERQESGATKATSVKKWQQ